MDDLIKINAKFDTSNIRVDNINNTEYKVLPTIAIVEGVLNNVYYPINEIKEFHYTWAGVPVPVGHPKNKEGDYISANNPKSENDVNIGKFYNVKVEQDKLKGEVWVNMKKAKALGFDKVVENIENGEMIEVSTGLFANMKTAEEGAEFKGKSYTHIATNIRPDHLALLPNEKGACSIEDGCGALRVNSEGACCEKCSNKQNNKNKDLYIIQTLKNLFGMIKNNGQSGLHSSDIYNNDNLIYNGMSKEEKIKFLSEHFLFANVDEEVLKSLDDKALDSLIANAKAEQEMKDNEKEGEKVDGDAEDKVDAKVNSLSDDDIALFNRLKNKENKRIEMMREVLKKNDKNWTDEILKTMTVESIEVVYNSLVANKKADYSLQGGNLDNNKEFKPSPILLNLKKEEVSK